MAQGGNTCGCSGVRGCYRLNCVNRFYLLLNLHVLLLMIYFKSV